MKIRTLAGIFFVSCTTLCLEVSLTRYFSISQHYHFAFLVVSIAFLGYGTSGSLLTLIKKIQYIDPDQFLPFSSLLFSLSTLLSFFLCNTIPFDFQKLSWDHSQIFFIFLFYLLLSLPFLFAGLTVSFAISKLTSEVNKIYFADLLGAGTGTLLTLFIFLPKGDSGVIPIISSLALLASLLFSSRRSFLFKLFLICLLAGEAVLFLLSPSFLKFRISPYKAYPIALRYPEAKPLFTKWNAISRIDILKSSAVRFAPGLSLLYKKNLPHQIGLSIDGGELTAITCLKNKKDPSLEFLSFLPSSLAYSFVQKPNVCIIQPKGGFDVLSAFIQDASHIKVIESNPLILKTLQKELAPFSGYLYFKKNIEVVSQNARSALRNEKEEYDLIVLSLFDVFGSSGTGIYGFGENYLYTIESFNQILENLSPEGIVSMSFYLLPPPRQEIRALATWIETLEKNNKDPALNIIAIRSWGTISYFIKNSPFSEKEIQKLKKFSDTLLFDLVYYPGIKDSEVNIHNHFKEPLYYNLTINLLSPENREKLYKNYLFRIKPASDDRPFFYNFFKGSRIKATYEALGNKWLPFLQEAFLVLILFIQSVIVAFIMIYLPLFFLQKRKKIKKSRFRRVFLYFSLIGMAFMLVEITFIQKFILFLGHPLYSTSIVIFSLLFSSGLGSYFSKAILGSNIIKNLKISIALCAGLIFISVVLLPFYHETLSGAALSLKIFLTFIAIFPVGFFMGFPFPTGIRLLKKEGEKIVPWAWATNSFFSVISSSLSLLIAFRGGYNLVLIIAGILYLFILPFLCFSNHGDKPNT